MIDPLRARLAATLAEWRTRRHLDQPCVYDCLVCGVLDDVEAALHAVLEAEDDALQIAHRALRAITVLDLGTTPEGKDDFYSGPDRFFRAHRLAREALVKLDAARPAAPEAK